MLCPKARGVFVIVETLNPASKGKSEGKGKKGQMGPRFLHGRPVAGHIAQCGGQSPTQPWPQPKEAGRAIEKPKKKGKGKGKSGGKASGK